MEGRTGESVGGKSMSVGGKSQSVEGKSESVGGQRESVTRAGDYVPSPRGSDALSSHTTIHSNTLQHTNSPRGSDASSPHSTQDGGEEAHSAKKKRRQVCRLSESLYIRVHP